MQSSILFKVPGRPSTRPVVILTGLAIEAKYSTTVSARLSRALSKAGEWLRCNCTPRRIFGALFSARMSAVVAAVALSAMWWHNITIANDIAAQEAVLADALCALPWGLVWTFRATFPAKKGGAL